MLGHRVQEIFGTVVNGGTSITRFNVGVVLHSTQNFWERSGNVFIVLEQVVCNGVFRSGPEDRVAFDVHLERPVILTTSLRDALSGILKNYIVDQFANHLGILVPISFGLLGIVHDFVINDCRLHAELLVTDSSCTSNLNKLVEGQTTSCGVCGFCG